MKLPQLLNKVHKLAYFKEGTIDLHYVPGQGRLVVGVGENASGKSFYRRLIQGMCHKVPVECIPISVQGRSASSPMRPFIYGSEEWQSTGENSVHTILTGITTCQKREKDHFIFWDEPDLGLSEGWAAGVGQKFAEFGRDLPKHTLGAFIITHSRPLVRQLVDLNPHYLYFGSNPPESLQAWIDQPVIPHDPATLPKMSHDRFLAIQKVIKGNDP